MTLNRLEEIIAEVSTLAMEGFYEAIRGLENEAIFKDTASWRAYIIFDRCEELGNLYREMIMRKESNITKKFLDMMDGWECEGFFSLQIYSQARWKDYWFEYLQADAKLWIARQMLSRMRGAR